MAFQPFKAIFLTAALQKCAVIHVVGQAHSVHEMHVHTFDL